MTECDPADHRCPQCGIRLDQIPMPQCETPAAHTTP